MANGGENSPVGLMKWLAEGFKNHPLRPAIFIVLFLGIGIPLGIKYGQGTPALAAIGIPVALAFVLIVVMLGLLATGRLPDRVATLLAYASAVFFCAVLGAVFVLGTIFVWRQMDSSPHIVPYPKQLIDVESLRPEAALTGNNVPVGRTEAERSAAGLRKASEWMLQGLEAMRVTTKEDGSSSPDLTQRFVVIKSKTGFPENYSKITGRINVASHLKIEEGILFLRSLEGDRPIYRQMACNCDIAGQFNGATFELFSPRTREEVVGILRLRHRESGEVSGEPSTYGISMEVNNE